MKVQSRDSQVVNVSREIESVNAEVMVKEGEDDLFDPLIQDLVERELDKLLSLSNGSL